MVQDPADNESRDAATGHEARGGAAKIMAADIGSVARFVGSLRLRNDVGARRLREASADVFVVAHERFRKRPDSALRPRDSLEKVASRRIQIHTMPVRVLHELRRNRPEVRFRIDVLPPHLQQLTATLRSDEAQPKPGADIRVLRGTGIPNAPDLVVGQHAIARRLLRRLLDPDDGIGRWWYKALIGAKGVDAGDQGTQTIRRDGRAGPQLRVQNGQEIFSRQFGRWAILPLRKQARLELALIFRPAAFVRLGVILYVLLREFAEREDLARRAFLEDGISPLCHVALRAARQLARVRE